MGGTDGVQIVVMDGPTASTLSQILPLLLLTLMVELRRSALHQRISRALFGVFFLLFGVIETVLVLSIDGTLYPFQWGDLLSALAIFTLLAMIFVISFIDPGPRRDDARERRDGGDPK
ncbi:hypothetical protein CIW49_23260 [Mycolicibacterium sp. P1-18]|uniref:hypothetical protein n=1 Tax=Mycolicibacterium sp. P1-18 TaxID=2024615 RepID=UPI0011F3C027|nr:hypothetical protein [Mycolicibacterium sp. P1-18]KAA0095383.1 hypothetical protein CIW49_23260 [Mycolicibacterium sp. P1-18]